MRRFRPIVLTALAAVLAMIPLSRSAFFGPMAVAIMGGLIVATVLTLLFLPALYAAWFRVKPRERGTKSWRRAALIFFRGPGRLQAPSPSTWGRPGSRTLSCHRRRKANPFDGRRSPLNE